MAKIDMIFNQETRKADPHPKRVTKWIHYSKLKDSKKQYRKGSMEEERERESARTYALADLIEADGEVLQDLLVRKIGTDEYEIIAGHHRRDACRILVEERGLSAFELLPCIIRNVSDVKAEFELYSTNGYGNKTHYEIMCELEGMKHLLETYPEEFPDLQTGRMVEKLEKKLGMKKTTVGEYLTISSNLGEKGMEEFRAGTLKKSAAVELAGLPVEKQEELLDKGVHSHKKIRQYKQSIKQNAAEQNRNDRCKETRSNKEEEDNSVIRFKNDNERKQWLKNYKKWPVWFAVPEASETYYRYDLPDGSSIVICEYYMYIQWKENYEDMDPETIITRNYLLKPGYHYLNDCHVCETVLIDHLRTLKTEGIA